MLFKHKSKKEEKEKIIVSFTQKLGMVCINSLEEYIKKNKIIKCYIVTALSPHPNVINYVKNIDLVEIIISSDFKKEIKKVKKLYKDSTIEIINLEDFGERNVMRDAI